MLPSGDQAVQGGRSRLPGRDEAADGRLQRRNDEHGGQADGRAQQRQHGHGRAHGQGRLVGLGRGLGARLAQKRRAVDLHEAGHGQRADHGQDRHAEHGRGGRAGCGHGAQQAQVHEQFAHEAVEGRQAADGHRAREEGQGGPGHGLGQPAQLVQLARVRAVVHRPGAEEQQRLEQAVVPDVQQAAGHAQGDPLRMAGSAAEGGQAQAHEDDADVLHAVIGQKALQLVLADGQDHAEEPADRAQEQQRPAPGGGRRGHQRQEARQAVDAHLEDHAGEHGRHVAGAAGVRAGQPEMQRHDAGLEPEAHQRQKEQGGPERPVPAPLRQRDSGRRSPWPAATGRTGRTGTAFRGAWRTGRRSRRGWPPRGGPRW